MRYLIAIMLYGLLANPGWLSAENIPPVPTATLGGGNSQKAQPQEGPQKVNSPAPVATPAPATLTQDEAKKGPQKSELAIIGKTEGKEPADFRFKMGESLQIKATGEHASKIQAELAKAIGSKGLTLYLDNVRMSGLTVSSLQGESANELRLYFQLSRIPYDDDNRKAWDTLLRKQNDYLMTLPVALAIGNELPLGVQSDLPFQLYIATKTTIYVLLVVGSVIFLVVYNMLVKNPTALRDVKGGYYSLGKSQMAFWGLLVLLTFVGVWLVTGTLERIPPQVLILLGISGATGLSAIVIGENKKVSKQTGIQTEITKLQAEQQQLEKEQLTTPSTFPKASIDRLAEIKSQIEALNQQPKVTESAGFWQDICDDGNGMSFHRLQVVLWTVVMGVVFVWTVTKVMSMPEFPENLLILLGISNGIYLGFKIPEKL